MSTMKAILYVRISELTDATTSPERQRADCQAYAQRAGLEVVDVFEDLDISGTKDLEKRPGLQAALGAVEEGRASYLVAAKIDRVARSVVTFNRVVQALQERGAALVSVAEGLDFGTPAGRMIANVLAVFAQFESETIGARVASAKQHLRQEGKWAGGRRPFGWEPREHPSGKGYVLALHPEEAPVLREVVEEVLTGKSFHGIAAGLNRRGVRTVIGKDWNARTVRQVVDKDAMTGRNGEERLLSDDEYVALKRALSMAASRSRRPDVPSGTDLPEPLLVEGLTCGACGADMGHGMRRDRGKPVRTYRCLNRRQPGSDEGCWQSASTPGVDGAIEEAILDRFGSFEAATIVAPSLVDPAAEERAELSERMTELEHDRYVRGMFSGDEGASRFARIYGDLEARLAALPAPYVDRSSSGATMPTGATLAEVWEGASVEERRALVESMAEGVVLSPTSKRGNRFDRDRVEVIFRIG